MKTIYKYWLDPVSIEMPRGAVLLTVQLQRQAVVLDGFVEKPCVWAVVDTEQPMVLRRMRVVGTGHALEFDPLRTSVYLGTVQLDGGRLVLHIFDEGEEEP